MSSIILEATDREVVFEVDPQRYKRGRFTMPAAVLQRLGLDWNEWVSLRIETLDGQRLWAGELKMVSGPEIDSADLIAHVRPGQRIRVVASRA
jgi:hypothetical protein